MDGGVDNIVREVEGEGAVLVDCRMLVAIPYRELKAIHKQACFKRFICDEIGPDHGKPDCFCTHNEVTTQPVFPTFNYFPLFLYHVNGVK